MSFVPVLRLRSHLAALLVVAMLLSLALVLGGVLAYRLPRIESVSRLELGRDVGAMRARTELLLQTRRNRLTLLEALIDEAPPAGVEDLLDRGVGDGSIFRLIYRLSPRGRILGVGLPEQLRDERLDLRGNDLSANPLFKALGTTPGEAWDGNYVSILNGERVVGLAIRDVHGDVLIAELPFAALLDAVQVAAGARPSAIWVVDRRGEIVADSSGGRDVRKMNIRHWPLMQALLAGTEAVDHFEYGGARFHAMVSHSPALGWYFIGRLPAGLANPAVGKIVLGSAALFVASLVAGLLIALFWARRVARPLDRIIERVDQGTHGNDAALLWPRGSVAEFNRLATDLESITAELREREQKSQAIFHASPVPMSVTDAENDHRLLDVNQAWCHEFRYRRGEVLGRTALEIGILADSASESALRQQLVQVGISGDVWLRRGDDTVVQMQVYVREAPLSSLRMVVWAALDVGPIRRAEEGLRVLNQQLEQRVRARTEALVSANAELSQTVERLRSAQDELVRAEKMAALGSLVAGVAHELNTPLGNGVMAVSAMADATRRFQSAMQGGVKRADLQHLVQSMEQGADIAGRNLRRAAALVHHFKQVAVDQTSNHRRCFELAEVVDEMVVSLRPSLARQPWRIEVQVPASGLQLDSYPGALGQVLGNLIQNAVVHGFDGRERGTVRITGGHGEAGWVWLRVVDDGNGIAPEHIARIFDPFMTTRMGRGGTGLGLHISHNAVVQLLGGTLTVHSLPGEGCRFEVRLPTVAPQPLEGADVHAASGQYV